MMRLSIIGTGYVGLVTGACLAERGHDVTCVDLDRSKVEAINSGQAPFHEDQLGQLLKRNVGSRLRCTTDLRAAVENSDLTFIAVGTPECEGRIDLQYVERAAHDVGRAMAGKDAYHTVVVKSTVVPGTTNGKVRNALESASGKRAGADFGLGMNPEFLTEGQAVRDFSNPDRIVIGGIDERSCHSIASVYGSFTDVPRMLTNTQTAEMIKYASNSVLATMISFANEFGRLCEAVGEVDVAEVMRGVHAASYFTVRRDQGEAVVAPITSFLESGCGFGGSCLPKDVAAILAQGRDLGLDMPMLSSVLAVNRSQAGELLRLIRREYPSLRGVAVTVLGLAFKPGTDDVRESPAFPVIRALLAEGAAITAYDPVVRSLAQDGMQAVKIAASLEEAVRAADVVVHITKWPEFESLAGLLKSLARAPLVVDGRRNLEPSSFPRYSGIGLGRTR